MNTEEEKAMRELKILLNNRIDEVERGEFANQTVDEIIEEVLREINDD
jgi:hypothetical protein